MNVIENFSSSFALSRSGKILCHYSTISLFPFIFQNDMNDASKSECDETFSISFALRVHFCHGKIYSTWQWINEMLLKRFWHLVSPDSQIKVYDYCCAYWIPFAAVDVFIPWKALPLMNHINKREKRSRNILSNGSGLLGWNAGNSFLVQ